MPFVQGQLTGREVTAVIDTACVHCSRPGGRVAYPGLAQAGELTVQAQSALFGFPRQTGCWPAG